jgi:hypothetical protein
MEGHALSEEFRKLQERGLRVLSVSVGSLRLPPAIEERTIKEWNANWLVNAQMESKRIERRITFVREDAKQDALKEYAAELSQNLVKANPDTPDAALRILLERSRNSIIRDERVLNRINKESAKPAMESTSGLSPSAVDMLRAGKESSSFDNKPQRRSSLDLDLMDQIIKKAEANDL